MARKDLFFEPFEYSEEVISEALPSALQYKQRVVQVFFEAADYLSRYNALSALQCSTKLISRKLPDFQTKAQGCIVWLYTILRVKMNASERKQLSEIEDYINNSEIMDINKLNTYYETIAKILDRIGITKIEIERLPPGRTMA